MAADLDKFPTYSGTGLNGSLRISQTYQHLVDTDHTQTEGAQINDDTICFATSSNARRLSAMCQKTYYEFRVDNLTDNVAVAKTVTGINNRAGIMGYVRLSNPSSQRPVFTPQSEHPLDWMPYAIYEQKKSYGVNGNVSEATNNVRFVTGFSLWETFGIIYIILADYDNTNGYFITDNSNNRLNLTHVTYHEYKTTYENDATKVPVAAYLDIKTGANNHFHTTPWNGYKEPDLRYTEYQEGAASLGGKREFSLSDGTTHVLRSFSSGMANNGNNPALWANLNTSIAPLVDLCYSSWACRYNNGFEKINAFYAQKQIGVVRGGSESYELISSTFVANNHFQNTYNGFITRVKVDNLIGAACTYGLIISTKNISPPSDSSINTKAKLKAWALANSDNSGLIYMPIPESDGSYAGKYRELNDFLNNSSKRESDYFPVSDGDLTSMLYNPDLSYDHSSGGGTGPTPSTDETPLNNATLNTLGVFNRSFAVSQNNLTALADYIYNADDSIVEAIYKGVKFMGDKPSDSLISVVLTPFNVPAFAGVSQVSYIKLGRQTTTVQGIVIPSNIQSVVDFGEVTLPYFHQEFGAEGICFLDHEPHTELTMYIPYVGMFNLSPTDVIGKTINVKLIIDWSTCSVCGCVFVNGVLLTYRKGTMGQEVNMTGSQRAVNISQLVSGILSVAASTAFIATAPTNPFATAAGIAGGLQGAASATNSIMQAPTEYKSTGTTTSGTAMYLPPYPYIIASYDVPNEPDNYGATIGYACNTFGPLNNFSGFTVCDGFKSDCARTSVENEMINQLANTGIII